MPYITVECGGMSSEELKSRLRKVKGLIEKQDAIVPECYDLDAKIKEVIFNPPATIVLWKDGTKTVVKATDEEYDREKGLAMAIVKKLCGNTGRYNEVFKEALEIDDLRKSGKLKKEIKG